ncbi:MAG: hypothetical protein J2P21_08795 [Chloracidobacterium sp.]|nr:hypothetical protein [Chloracidobacterium sp.]
MHNRAKQAKIQTPARLADNLIGSLGGLTAGEGAELRRQVVMLINHSYALGYVAGASLGFVSRMRLKLALASRRWGLLALSAIRERLTRIFSNYEPDSRQMLASASLMRLPAPADAVPIRCFENNRPAALLAPAKSWEGFPDHNYLKAFEGMPYQFRVTQELRLDIALPTIPIPSETVTMRERFDIKSGRFGAKKQPDNNPAVANPGRQGIFPGLQASRP